MHLLDYGRFETHPNSMQLAAVHDYLFSNYFPRATNGLLTKIGCSVGQKLDFWAKNRYFGPTKKTHFLVQTMFWP